MTGLYLISFVKAWLICYRICSWFCKLFSVALAKHLAMPSNSLSDQAYLCLQIVKVGIIHNAMNLGSAVMFRTTFLRLHSAMSFSRPLETDVFNAAGLC